MHLLDNNLDLKLGSISVLLTMDQLSNVVKTVATKL